MKPFILATILTLISMPVAAQWTSHNIQPVGCVMHAVKMRTDSVGVAVGDSGVIRWSAFYADDAGQRSLMWSSRRWHEPVRFNDVVLLRGAGYLAVGNDRAIVRADNERDEPRTVSVSVMGDLLCVDRREDTIVIGTSTGTLLYSTDLGMNFMTMMAPTTLPIVDLCVDGNGRWTAITPREVLSSQYGSAWTFVNQHTDRPQRQISTQPSYIEPNWLLYRVGDDWLVQVSTDGGATWLDHFGPSDDLRITDANAQALSITASADGMSHSVMFMRRNGPSVTFYHYVSFDAGLSWTDQCIQLFTDFVGESQVMVNDSTLITTSLTGQMLTFSRHGLGVQQWWRAPESVNIPFEPWISHAFSDGGVIGGPSRLLDLSFAPRVAEWTFATSLDRINSVCASSDRTYLLMDQRSYDEQFNLVSRAHILDREGYGPFTDRYSHAASYGGTMIDCDSTGRVAMIPYGKSVVWSADHGQQYTAHSFADTSIWSTSIGTLLGGGAVWVQTLRLSDPQAPFSMISDDGGITWQETGLLPFQASSSTSVGTVVIIAAAERIGLTQVRVRIARSTDRGATWTAVVNEVRAAAITNNAPLSVRGARVMCVAPSSVWWSDDAGLTWREAVGPTLSDDDGLTTGHWTSDTTAIAYSRGGQYHTTMLPLITTNVDDVHDELSLGDVISITAVDVMGRMIQVATLSDLPRGLWYVVLTHREGARTKTKRIVP